MKVVKTGSSYKIYGNDLQVHDQLPVGAYIVRFSKMQGFYLDSYSGLEVNESKIYGVHMEKIAKVMKTFGNFERNLGTILSGDKGIGKSLFARILCQTSIEAGYPVIVVDEFNPGIHSFLEEIEQEAVVLFDEFDKTFPVGQSRMGGDGSENNNTPQVSLLSLLDGTSSGKKLYVVTCNKIHSLNEYLVNRPGRFHYHFRFNYPTPDEVTTYLKDKVSEQFWGEIPKVVDFSCKIDLNYDCLRAIAYELNTGESFAVAISDLNIMNLREQFYDVELRFTDGTSTTAKGCRIDMFSSNSTCIGLRDIGFMDVDVDFVPNKAVYQTDNKCSILQPKDFKVNTYGSIKGRQSDDDGEEIVEEEAPLVPSLLIISQIAKTNYHYAL